MSALQPLGRASMRGKTLHASLLFDGEIVLGQHTAVICSPPWAGPMWRVSRSADHHEAHRTLDLAGAKQGSAARSQELARNTGSRVVFLKRRWRGHVPRSAPLREREYRTGRDPTRCLSRLVSQPWPVLLTPARRLYRQAACG